MNACYKKNKSFGLQQSNFKDPCAKTYHIIADLIKRIDNSIIDRFHMNICNNKTDNGSETRN